MTGSAHAHQMIVLAAVLCLSAPAAGSWVPRADVFRSAVASSDIIAVGVVVSTDSLDAVQRVSRVEVVQPLYGEIDRGDTLLLDWYRDAWASAHAGVPPREAREARESRDPEDLTGVPVLWLLRRGEYASLAWEPVVLDGGRLSAIEDLVQFIRHPPVPDLLSSALADTSTAGKRAWVCAVSEKLATVASYLGGYLRGVGWFGPGRSN